MIFNKNKKKASTIKIDEAENVEINATIKDAAIAFFALAQFLMDSGLTEVQVKLNLDAAIRQYKKKKNAEIENIKATHYAEMVDAGMRERKLERSLWLARAERAKNSALSYHLVIESHPNKDVAATYKRKANKWEKVKVKCLKKAEEYK